MITPSTAIIGLLASIVTELFKLIPQLRQNTITSAITAIVVIAVGTIISTGTFSLDTFVGALVFALTSYKTIVQPVASSISSPTQA